MNILCGIPYWNEWKTYLCKLPYNFYFNDLNNLNIVLELIKKYKIDIIIPLTIVQIEFLITNYNELIKFISRIICDKNIDTIKILDDKYEFCKYFPEYTPQVFIAQIQNTKTIIKQPIYPCILKLNNAFGGNGSFIINSDTELANAHSPYNYIIQKYIVSPYEYGGHFYVNQGIILFSVYYLAANYTPQYIRRGKMDQCMRITNNYWNETFSDIFKKLNYTGFACANFKIFKNKPIIFEINPRLGGTIVCTNCEDLKDIIASSLL